MYVQIIRSLYHGAQGDNILGRFCNDVHDFLQCHLQSIEMLMLIFVSVPQIRPEGVTEPTKSLFDVLGRLSCFF
jgi:hypothetical protein